MQGPKFTTVGLRIQDQEARDSYSRNDMLLLSQDDPQVPGCTRTRHMQHELSSEQHRVQVWDAVKPEGTCLGLVLGWEDDHMVTRICLDPSLQADQPNGVKR